MNPNGFPSLGELKHISSTRLTPSLSIHTFSAPASHEFTRNYRPSQHLTLQFPPDLDPVAGPQNLSDKDRCLSFTPYHVQYTDGEVKTVSLMARNGRVTGLLGLPRPRGPLIADVVEIGGGFSSEILDRADQAVCIAGGTGIAPFIAMAMAKKLCTAPDTQCLKPSLVCSLRGDDFGVIDYLWSHKMLHLQNWKSVRIFVTPGEESNGMAAGKSQEWWSQRFEALDSDNSIFRLGRMEKEDLNDVLGGQDGPVLFCGSKQLEWQVKMWLLGKKETHCTDR
ncbi:uncharacterized protein QYS62_007742 [Fusarium acuminatum]|uniref:FAD-binding FR-type domain-containing protein n=1 Tax=Fusarium acuminatum TaxID=5515 RepID=A0ABZ2X350_9HYPO